MLTAMSTTQIAFAVTVVLTAYLVRGMAGFGSGLVAIPLLTLVLPVSLVVPVVGLLDYTASLGHGIRYRRDVRWRDILPMLPFMMAGMLMALLLFKTVDSAMLRKGMGVFVLAYGACNLLPQRAWQLGSRLWAVPAGGLGGLVGTLFGTGGPFYVVYLALRGLDKLQFRATIAMLFVLDGGSRVAGYLASGLYTLDTLRLVAVAFPLLALGMYVGGRIHTNLSEKAFNRGIAILLLGSGGALLLH